MYKPIFHLAFSDSSKYLNYSDDDLLQEYIKSIDNLTIDPSNRLQLKVKELITGYANQNDIDLIVVGTHHQSKFRQLLLGSVAYGVISHSSCPVLVVL
ncbi:MAG: universal stress protein [Thermoproteota archaeon]|nr:universal stress protein [Thermoproteota archaeon]